MIAIHCPASNPCETRVHGSGPLRVPAPQLTGFRAPMWTVIERRDFQNAINVLGTAIRMFESLDEPLLTANAYMSRCMTRLIMLDEYQFQYEKQFGTRLDASADTRFGAFLHPRESVEDRLHGWTP